MHIVEFWNLPVKPEIKFIEKYYELRTILFYVFFLELGYIYTPDKLKHAVQVSFSKSKHGLITLKDNQLWKCRFMKRKFKSSLDPQPYQKLCRRWICLCGIWAREERILQTTVSGHCMSRKSCPFFNRSLLYEFDRSTGTHSTLGNNEYVCIKSNNRQLKKNGVRGGPKNQKDLCYL